MEDEDRILGEGEVLVVCKDAEGPCINKYLCKKILVYDIEFRGKCTEPFTTTWTSYLIYKDKLDRIK